MHDTRSDVQGGTVAANLAAAFGVSAAQVEATLPLVATEFGGCLEQATLSRAGLASLVEAVGGRWANPLEQCEALHSQAVRADGNAALDQVLGSRERARALMERAARAGQFGEGRAELILPALAAVTMSRLASRARDNLAEVVKVMPPLGHWGRGEPHADLADIVRRGCGAGPYGPVKLRRVVRRAVAGPAHFKPRGPLRWYLRFIAKPAVLPMRWLMERLRSSA